MCVTQGIPKAGMKARALLICLNILIYFKSLWFFLFWLWFFVLVCHKAGWFFWDTRVSRNEVPMKTPWDPLYCQVVRWSKWFSFFLGLWLGYYFLSQTLTIWFFTYRYESFSRRLSYHTSGEGGFEFSCNSPFSQSFQLEYPQCTVAANCWTFHGGIWSDQQPELSLVPQNF